MRLKVRDATAAKQLARQARLANISEVISQRPLGASNPPDRKLNSREEACRGRRDRERLSAMGPRARARGWARNDVNGSARQLVALFAPASVQD